MSTTAPLLPETAPFTPDQIQSLNAAIGGATRDQRVWLQGFLAGFDAGPATAGQVAAAGAAGLGLKPATAASATAPAKKTPLTLLYASESGNAEGLAAKAKKQAQKLGFDARVVDMGDADVGVLAKAQNLVVYAATWGEGDPPERARDFYDALMGDDAPDLSHLSFAVLGLGDSAYVDFCETGKRIDARIEELGGRRAAPRIDLDLDFAKSAKSWTDDTLSALKPKQAEPSTVVHVAFAQTGDVVLEADEEIDAFDEANPLEAGIIERVNLNGSGSTRETWHVELATDVPGFAYAPGDSIGILPENDPRMVEAVMDAAHVGDDADLAVHLQTSADVTTLSIPLLSKYAALTERKDVAELAADRDAALAFIEDRQIVDLFHAFPETLTREELKGLLRPLPSRLYSVASSPTAHAGETHLLVGAVRWSAHDRARGGVASTYVADRRSPDDALKVFVKPNRHFKLPVEPERPVIMIGAGTGVAPYRGFVAERAEIGAAGKNWLIFGERNYTNDFLYQLEWQDHLAAGTLAHLDVAFSRDQPEKIYVQHRLWEQRARLRAWLADGAHLYVCGDEKGMARDVDEILARILGGAESPDGGDPEAGRAALKALSKAGRYQRDVY